MSSSIYQTPPEPAPQVMLISTEEQWRREVIESLVKIRNTIGIIAAIVLIAAILFLVSFVAAVAA